jgi:hypothetical protein
MWQLCGYTSQETHYVSATKPNRLMLFREIIAVYCENHTEHINTLCGQNAEFWYVIAGGKYSNHCRHHTRYMGTRLRAAHRS